MEQLKSAAHLPEEGLFDVLYLKTCQIGLPAWTGWCGRLNFLKPSQIERVFLWASDRCASWWIFFVRTRGPASKCNLDGHHAQPYFRHNPTPSFAIVALFAEVQHAICLIPARMLLCQRSGKRPFMNCVLQRRTRPLRLPLCGRFGPRRDPRCDAIRTSIDAGRQRQARCLLNLICAQARRRFSLLPAR